MSERGGLDRDPTALPGCRTCAWACLAVLAECVKKIDGKELHPRGICPEALTCEFWEQGEDFRLYLNSKA